MSVWYHAKYELIGQLYSRPKHGPIYNYNKTRFRIYVSYSYGKRTKRMKCYQVTTSPEEYGWSYIGEFY